MKIQWLKKPKEDLRESFRYLAERNPDAAWRLRDEVEKRVVVLTDHPKIAPLGRVQGTRVLHHAQQWPPGKKSEKRA
jgi:plasmid stabilization system protein ParE